MFLLTILLFKKSLQTPSNFPASWRGELQPTCSLATRRKLFTPFPFRGRAGDGVYVCFIDKYSKTCT